MEKTKENQLVSKEGNEQTQESVGKSSQEDVESETIQEESQEQGQY